MSIFKKIILTLFILFYSIGSISAYNLTERDYHLVEKIDTKVFTLIDNKPNITAEKVVKVIDKIIEKKSKNKRLVAILEMISDDISYEYSLGKYSEDDFEEEIFEENEYEFDENEEIKLEDEYIDKNFKDGKIEEDKDKKNNQKENNLGVRASYKITADKITLISGKKYSKDDVVLKMTKKIIPNKFLEQFGVFHTYNNPEGNTYAFVGLSESDISKYDMTLNIATFYKDGKINKKESYHTIIHEFAHVLTLNIGQLRIASPEENIFFEKVKSECKTNFIAEGCLNKNSYFNKFIDRFWKKNFKASQDDIEDDFFTNNELDYVSVYASTNPGEDIAESFAYFVLSEKPKGNSIAEQKKKFFYDFPELVKLRSYMRKNIEK